jgi:hypothetical protein
MGRPSVVHAAIRPRHGRETGERIGPPGVGHTTAASRDSSNVCVYGFRPAWRSPSAGVKHFQSCCSYQRSRSRFVTANLPSDRAPDYCLLFAQPDVPPIRKVLTVFPLFPVRPTSSEGTNSISAGKTPMGAGKTGIADDRVRLAQRNAGPDGLSRFDGQKECVVARGATTPDRDVESGENAGGSPPSVPSLPFGQSATRRPTWRGGRRPCQRPAFLPVPSALRTPAI